MAIKKKLFSIILIIFVLSGINVFAQNSNKDLIDMENQLGKVFEFVGLEKPNIKVEQNKVIIDLDLPNSYAEDSTLSYIMINAAEIAPHTKEIIIKITSDKANSIQASADTNDVLDYVDGKITEQQLNDKIEIDRVKSSLNIVFMLIALVIIIIVFRKIFEYAHIHYEKEHIHRNHSVHEFMGQKSKKKIKKRAKKYK